MTEPDAGSDLDRHRRRAPSTSGDDAGCVTGSKTWITSAPVADFFTVFARTGRRARSACSWSSAARPGLAVGTSIEKMGVRASLTVGGLLRGHARRPACSASPTAGATYLREILAEIRVDDRGAGARRRARGVRGGARATRRERKQFGKPIDGSRPCRSTSPRWRSTSRPRAGSRTGPPGAATRSCPNATARRRWRSSSRRRPRARLRPRRARARELRLRHRQPVAALPARRALHADRRRHVGDPAGQHREGAVTSMTAERARSACSSPSPASTATTSARSSCAAR